MGLGIALFLRRLRYLYRLAWHKIAGRYPRYRWRRGWDGGRPCTEREQVAFRRLASMARSKGAASEEPQYGRKLP